MWGSGAVQDGCMMVMGLCEGCLVVSEGAAREGCLRVYERYRASRGHCIGRRSSVGWEGYMGVTRRYNMGRGRHIQGSMNGKECGGRGLCKRTMWFW